MPWAMLREELWKVISRNATGNLAAEGTPEMAQGCSARPVEDVGASSRARQHLV